MAEFLSTEWFDALAATLSSIIVGEPGDDGLALGQVIVNSPGGTVNYTICLGGARPGVLVRDSVEAAQVTLVEDYTSAMAIVEGASIAEMLGAGKIKVSGDANVLLGASTELGALAIALARSS